jgi:hypothetical protein
MSTKETYWKRVWLNRKGHEGNAFIQADVEVYSGTRSVEPSVYAGITIADCSRQISLFCELENINNKRQHANNLYKLDTLLRVIGETRNAYVVAVDAAVDKLAETKSKP